MKIVIYFIIGFIGFVNLFSLSSCKSQSESKLKVAATSVPHAEILEQIKPELAKEHIYLDIIVVEDYNTPNRALNEGEVDANFFQHRPFLDLQIKEFGYPLVSLAAIHIEPMGLYSKKFKNLKDLKSHASIAIPSDPTNQARALCLLQSQKILILDRCDAETSLLNVSGNPLELQLIEMDSPLLARALDDVDLAAITTNFALQAGLSPQKDALGIETSDSLFANILVIREREDKRPDLQLLKKALTSEKIRSFILQKYQGAVVPAF